MTYYFKWLNEENKQIAQFADNFKAADMFGLTETTEQKPEQGHDGILYAAGFAPQPSIEEQNRLIEAKRRALYVERVDPLTAQIGRLLDEEQTPETVAKIETLRTERSARVYQIRQENPYVEAVEQVSEQVTAQVSEQVTED